MTIAASFFESIANEKFIGILTEEMPKAILETLSVTVISTLIAFLIGLPLGVILVAGENNYVFKTPKWILTVIGFIINILRSVPFLILMILVIPLTRSIVGKATGTAASVVPLSIAAFPFIARLVEGSLREVDRNVVEAAQSMGASPLQIIFKVMLKESVPSLISNITIALTTVLGYSAMSGIIGGGGLGTIAINYGYYRYENIVMVAAVVLLVVIVQVFQSVGTRLAVKLDRRQR